jgi:endonuclease/exonuclease/phosphatase family metal-dependent hydrolase
MAEVVLYALLFLFFFQMLAEFVEAVYAFGLLQTSIPPEIVSVLLLFSPIVLFFLPARFSHRLLLGLGALILAARLAEPLLDTRGRMLASGVGVSGFMLLFPLLLYRLGREQGQPAALPLSAGLTLGVSLSILLRALNSGSDLSTWGGYQGLGWVLVAGAALLFYRRFGLVKSSAAMDQAEGPASPGKVLGLSLGWAAVLVLLYFAFTAPHVIARWTGANALLILALLALALGAFALALAGKIRGLARLSPALLWALNLLFVLSLVLTILAHQIRFPSDPAAYPLAEPPAPAWSALTLALMLILAPLTLLDFLLFAREALQIRLNLRALGAGFTLAALYMLVMIFAQVFTTVYDYIPLVGPFFRDKFWLVFLVAGIVLLLPLSLIARRTLDLREKAVSGAVPGLVIAAGVVALVGAYLTSARPPRAPAEQRSLNILTYNVQQGYSQSGSRNFDGQLALIRSLNPDLIGLQETDTNRIAGGNNDLVRYFADRLDAYVYYGPKTVVGTFGIALLSRYPIQKPRTFYMYSEGEQTATIHAQISAGGTTFNVFVTHLGNGGPLIQQQAILQEVAGKDNVLLMGDFNFRPDSEQYRLTRRYLEDAWLLKWPSGVDDQGVNPVDRIDQVFVSPGIQVREARFIDSPASDHPALWIAIEW